MENRLRLRIGFRTSQMISCAFMFWFTFTSFVSDDCLTRSRRWAVETGRHARQQSNTHQQSSFRNH